MEQEAQNPVVFNAAEANLQGWNIQGSSQGIVLTSTGGEIRWEDLVQPAQINDHRPSRLRSSIRYLDDEIPYRGIVDPALLQEMVDFAEKSQPKKPKGFLDLITLTK